MDWLVTEAILCEFIIGRGLFGGIQMGLYLWYHYSSSCIHIREYFGLNRTFKNSIVFRIFCHTMYIMLCTQLS